MASPLALLIQPAKNPPPGCKKGADKDHHLHLAHQLKEAFSPAPALDTDIIHYAWVNVLPTSLTGGEHWLLVSVAYDLAFGPYIQNLLKAQHAMWDAIFPCIEGGSALVPVLDHLDAATNWVCSVDLNHGATHEPVQKAPYAPYCAPTNDGAVTGFFQRYIYTVTQIVPKG